MKFFFGKENIFRCLVALKKMLWKTHFLLVIHIFSTFKQIYNIVSQYINTIETKPNKNIHQIRSNWEREREREISHGLAGGSIERQQKQDRVVAAVGSQWVARLTVVCSTWVERKMANRWHGWQPLSLSLWKWFECRIDV